MSFICHSDFYLIFWVKCLQQSLFKNLFLSLSNLHGLPCPLPSRFDTGASWRASKPPGQASPHTVCRTGPGVPLQRTRQSLQPIGYRTENQTKLTANRTQDREPNKAYSHYDIGQRTKQSLHPIGCRTEQAYRENQTKQNIREIMDLPPGVPSLPILAYP